MGDLLTGLTWLLILGWQGWEAWLIFASKKFGREVIAWHAAS